MMKKISNYFLMASVFVIANVPAFADDGVCDLIKGLKSLLNDKQIAVITLGSKGSIYYCGGHTVEVPTFPVKPVDTTGAGDAFYSYFLASLVNHPDFVDDDEKIRHYLTRANVVGALTTLKKGAINSAPTEEQIDDFFKTYR